jgi:hypothetical protein
MPPEIYKPIKKTGIELYIDKVHGFQEGERCFLTKKMHPGRGGICAVP